MKSPFLAIALLFAAPLSAQTFTPAESAQVDAIVAKALATSGNPSASVAIVRGGKLAFAKAYGKQSDAIPTARADAKYQIASVSKQFTAAALLTLRDDGKLSLDDKVSKFVPGISGGGTITIRQLLSHTSGLQDYWPQDYSFAAMEQPTKPQGIVDSWARKPLDFTPGSQWQYSNTGYVVAGMVIEKVSGMPMLDYLQTRILRPLGIDAVDLDVAKGPGFPVGYHRAALGPVRAATPPAPGWLYAAGELSMSMPDLAKWDIARIDRALLPAKDWAEQEAPVILTDGASSHYGLGVQLGEMRGHAYVTHGGEAVGFLTDNRVFVADRAAILVAVNADFGDATAQIGRGIAAILFPDRPSNLAGIDEARRTALAHTLFDQLRAGTPDRALLTADANGYFTSEVIGDYKLSFATLGAPASFTLQGPPALRGGFIQRVYAITYPSRKLTAVTYSELGQDGKFEQMLIMPAS